MSILKNSKLIWLKGALFLALGVAASALLLIELPTYRLGLLHLLAIWGFCRAYYFAFYVIQHYVDPQFRFAGLIDFARFCLQGANVEGQRKS